MSSRGVFLFATFGYLFSLIDDSPVNADQLLGPRNQFEMEVILHILTIVFLSLSVLEAGKWEVKFAGGTLAALAFLVSTLDDFPQVSTVLFLREHFWYQFDLIIHVVSVLIFYAAVKRVAEEPALRGGVFRKGSSSVIFTRIPPNTPTER